MMNNSGKDCFTRRREGAKTRRGIEFKTLLFADFAASREKILIGMDGKLKLSEPAVAPYGSQARRRRTESFGLNHE